MFDGALVDLSDFTSVDEIVGVAHNGGGITWSVKPHKHMERWLTFSAPAPAKAAGGEPATNCFLKALSNVGTPRNVISVAAATLQCDMGVPRVLSYSVVGRCLPGYMTHTVDVHAGRLSGKTKDGDSAWLPLQLPGEIGVQELPKFMKTLWDVFIEVSLCESCDATLDLTNHLSAAASIRMQSLTMTMRTKTIRPL